MLPGEVHVQVYATPAGTNSYGWHYDFEDVFIAQTAGVKDYYFRQNTVARDTRLGDQLDFTSVRRETSPIYQSRLIAGDWLYIPSTWWHLVKCVEDSLSISVGVMPPEALRDARRLPAGWTGKQDEADDAPLRALFVDLLAGVDLDLVLDLLDPGDLAGDLDGLRPSRLRLHRARQFHDVVLGIDVDIVGPGTAAFSFCLICEVIHSSLTGGPAFWFCSSLAWALNAGAMNMIGLAMVRPQRAILFSNI